MVSEIMLHSKGHAAPPKVSLRASNVILSFGRLAQDWTADSALRWQQQKADLKSILVARML